MTTGRLICFIRLLLESMGAVSSNHILNYSTHLLKSQDNLLLSSMFLGFALPVLTHYLLQQCHQGKLR